MVINHAGVAWLDHGVGAPPSALAAEFVGSLAPVLFFLATGVGYGFSRGQGAPSLPALLYKPLALLCADALMWAGRGSFVGLDFLGFIGCSMLVLEWLRRRARPERTALVLVGLLLFGRFLLAPLSSRFLTGDLQGWVAIALGQHGLVGFSYLPFPWLAYPLLGFLLGRQIVAAPSSGVMALSNLGRLTAGIGVLGIGGAILLANLGATLFRWGSLSLSFFVLGVGACGAGWWLAGVLVAHLPSRWCAAASLRGVASLALVPIHYAIVELGRRLGCHDITEASTFFVAAAVAVLLAFAFAKAFAHLLESGLRGGNRIGLLFVSWGGAAVALPGKLLLAPEWGVVCLVVGQLLLCIPLTLRKK